MRYTITNLDLETIASNVDDGSFEEATFRSDYSGRGMYSRTCFGYVGENPIAVALELAIIVAAQDTADKGASDFYNTVDIIRDSMNLIGQPSSDSMGMGTIWYWPNITVEQETADAE